MSFILFGRFNLKTYNASKTVMKRSHNLLTNVKVTKNVRRPNCRIIINIFFRNLSK